MQIIAYDIRITVHGAIKSRIVRYISNIFQLNGLHMRTHTTTFLDIPYLSIPFKFTM